MRIRTIKPEFWVSESIGRLSRDARLLFIGLWSFSEDSGRARGALNAIAGALFPYDADAREHIGEWLSELEHEGMVRRYTGPDGNQYLDIPKFLQHQNINRPSKPRLPAFPEPSVSTHGALSEHSLAEPVSGNREPVSGNRERKPRAPRADDSVAIHIFEAYPKRVGKPAAIKAIKKALRSIDSETLKARTEQFSQLWAGEELSFCPHPSTWFNQERFNDDPSTWNRPSGDNRRSGTPSRNEAIGVTADDLKRKGQEIRAAITARQSRFVQEFRAVQESLPGTEGQRAEGRGDG